MPDLRDRLRECFAGRTCIMGLGNAGYGDDGVGVYLADALAVRPPGIDVICAGTMPERFIHDVISGGYDHLLFIDAVECGAEPGAVAFLDADEMVSRFPQISTHKLSVGLLAKLVEENGIKSQLLGVQPGSIRSGAELSPEVGRTADILISLFGETVEAIKHEAA